MIEIIFFFNDFENDKNYFKNLKITSIPYGLKALGDDIVVILF